MFNSIFSTDLVKEDLDIFLGVKATGKDFAIIGQNLLGNAIALAAPAKADYPPNVNGLLLVAGPVSAPIAIDTTPKSIPANSKVSILKPNQTTATMSANVANVFRFTSFRKSTYAEATITPPNVKSSTFLGAVKTDVKGNLQLPAFALFKAGKYLLTVKVAGKTRIVVLTVIN